MGTNRTLRPSTATFFERWGAKATFINGIWTGSIGHPAFRARIFHGTSDRRTADLPTLAGQVLGIDTPLGVIDLSGALEPGPLGPTSARMGRRQQVAGLLDPTLAAPPPADSGRPLVPWEPSESAEVAARKVMASRAARWATGPRVPFHVDSAEARERADAWREVADPASLSPDLLNLEGQLDLAVDLLLSDVAASALVSIDGWDTHSADYLQDDQYESLFVSLDTLMNSLAEKNALDDVAVFVISAMARNPALNDLGGTDHWPLTSAILLGGGLGTGRVLGGTDENFGPRGVDRVDGEASDRAPVLTAADFLGGLIAALGGDPEEALPGCDPLLALSP